MKKPYEITLSIVERKSINWESGAAAEVLTRSREACFRCSRQRTRAHLEGDIKVTFNGVLAHFQKQRRRA